jgi:nicotinamide-nucleotide amidase
MWPKTLLKEAEHTLALYREKACMLATAESCTGGMIAAVLTEIAGSSDVVDRGFVTYSNNAKNTMLGVPLDDIDQHGAVSECVAQAMAFGAIEASRADVAVAVTGVAGPGGGSDKKPVGMVCFGIATRGQAAQSHTKVFAGQSRLNMRLKTTAFALSLLQQAL